MIFGIGGLWGWEVAWDGVDTEGEGEEGEGEEGVIWIWNWQLGGGGSHEDGYLGGQVVG